jgi:hypothetical protein
MPFIISWLHHLSYGAFLHLLEHGHAEQEILVEPAAAEDPAHPEQAQHKPRCIPSNNPCLLF